MDFSKKLHTDYDICYSKQPWKVNLTGIQIRKAAQIFRYPGQREAKCHLPPPSRGQVVGIFVFKVRSNRFCIEDLNGTKPDALLNCPQNLYILFIYIALFFSKLTSRSRLVFTPTKWGNWDT